MADGLIGPLGHEEIKIIRGLSKGDAELWLAAKFPGLTSDDKEIALRLAGRDLKTLPPATSNSKYDPTRRLWLAAAWLMGASWRNLAALHGVAGPTILLTVDRILPKEERQAQRLGTRMSVDRIAMYRASFTANIQHLQSLTPLEIAQWLLDNTELDI